MCRNEMVTKIREFNRFYMPRMNLLGNHYLGSEYSVTEARVFFEIYENEGCNAAHIAKVMNIDKSYLGRILAAHEKKGYLRRVASNRDRRSYRLYLTEEGRRRAETLIFKSEEEIAGILHGLTEEEQTRMEQALNTIISLLRKGDCQNENCTI